MAENFRKAIIKKTPKNTGPRHTSSMKNYAKTGKGLPPAKLQSSVS